MGAVKERLRWVLAGSPLERPAKLLWATLNGHKPSRYDAQTEEIIRTRSKRDWNCLDVGANNGDIADLILDSCPKGQHILFEPIPANAALLRHKYRKRANVTVIEAALSDTVGTTTFNYNVAHPATSGIKQQQYHTAGNLIEVIDVPLRRLDDEVSGRIDLIKIDVEGAELHVLRGASETIAREKPLVIFEHGPYGASAYGYGAREVFDYFANLSFGVYLLADFLEDRGSLHRQQMIDIQDRKQEWYFIAAPN